MKEQLTGSGATNFSSLLFPTYTGPEIRRYFGEAWSMHLPFAWDLIRELQPQIFVELGVYRGESYFGFCQSVAEHGLATRCYGVDTWRGDIHMGSYGPEIGGEVEQYNRRYSSFSKLLKMTFDEALSDFADDTIDLLHIDGGHQYEEVKHDFESWLPKLSKRSIVLLHDVTVKEADFGVWRLWQEIARKGNSFVFQFGHGLGLWKRNLVSKEDSPFIQDLLRADESQQCEITAHYAIAAAALNSAKAEEKRQQDIKTGRLQVFMPRAGRYSPDDCYTSTFPKATWRRIEVDLPVGVGDGTAPLRFDPGNEIGVIQIARIQVRMATNQLIWRARGVAELAQLVVGGTAVVVPDERVFRILNYGIDPQVLLPRIDVASGSPLKLEIWLRLDIGPETVGECFAALQSRQRAALAKREAQLRETEQQRAALENNLRSFEEQRLSLEVALDEHQAELAAHRSELERLEREVWENRVRRADFAVRLKERESSIREIQESFVWKVAKPLWKAERHLSRRKAAKPEPAAGEIVFALDGPGIWNARRDSVELTGWCFTRGGPQIVGVRAKIGRKSYFARYGLQRDDLAKTTMADPATLYSGFSLRIPVTPETSVIRLEAITHNGPWRLVLEHSLAGPAPPRHRSTSAPTIEPPPTERPDRPIHANGSQPVLYPNVSADEVLPLLGPHIHSDYSYF